MREPNHICKTCGKAYYACIGCDETNSWRAACCSIGCYDKYVEVVLIERNKGRENKEIVEIEVTTPEVENYNGKTDKEVEEVIDKTEGEYTDTKPSFLKKNKK